MAVVVESESESETETEWSGRCRGLGGSGRCGVTSILAPSFPSPSPSEPPQAAMRAPGRPLPPEKTRPDKPTVAPDISLIPDP